MWRKISFALILIVVLLGTTGCIKINKKDTKTVAPTDLGGVFVSIDQMETWKNSSLLMTPGVKDGSIDRVDVYVMRQDPSDSKALYAGTRANGLYYSYNEGAGWTKADSLPKGFVRDVAVDPKNKCTVYAAVDAKIFKSIDCARTWVPIFYSDKDTKLVAVMDVDWFDSKTIYAGLSDGTFLRTINGGESWQKMKQFTQRLNRIIVDPNDSRIVYAGLLKLGLFKSTDKGETWIDLTKEGMKKFSNSKEFYDFSVSKTPKNVIVYASAFGLLKSGDAGETWTDMKILTKKNTEVIYSVAIDNANGNNIYYGTDKAVYKSIDGGVSWEVKKMPTSRAVGDLLVHLKDGKKIFMGVKTPVEN
jgi:photosystem II stability/assembly factor-like uncharacterized protein